MKVPQTYSSYGCTKGICGITKGRVGRECLDSHVPPRQPHLPGSQDQSLACVCFCSCTIFFQTGLGTKGRRELMAFADGTKLGVQQE